MSPARRAIVIGGSVAGLFAAALLRRVGWDVTVYERSDDDLAARGAGIGTDEALFDVMRRAGVPIDPSLGVAIHSRQWLDRSGAVLGDVPIGWVTSAWARIYRPLRTAVPAACLRFRMRLERVEQHSAGVVAHFADGSRDAADLLVAADGLHSTVRAQFLPALQPCYAGYVAWRGVVDESDIPPEARASLVEHATFCFPPGELFLALAIPGRGEDTRPGHRRYYFIWYRPADLAELAELCTDGTGRRHGVSIPPPLIRPQLVRDLKASARTLLPAPIADVVGRTAQPLLQAIFDLESPRLAFGRVVLLGDAAFVARPHVAAGVTKAALDAEALADALAGTQENLDAALARYERDRIRFGRWIVAHGRHLGARLESGAAQGPDPLTIMRVYGTPGLREVARALA